MKKILILLLLFLGISSFSKVFELQDLQSVILPYAGNDNQIFAKAGGPEEENDKHFKWFNFYNGIPCLLATGYDGLIAYIPLSTISPFKHTHQPFQIKNLKDYKFKECIWTDKTKYANDAKNAVEAGEVNIVPKTDEADLAQNCIEADNGLEDDAPVGTTPIMGDHGVWDYHDILLPAGGKEGQIAAIDLEGQKAWINSQYPRAKKTDAFLYVDKDGQIGYMSNAWLYNSVNVKWWVSPLIAFPIALILFILGAAAYFWLNSWLDMWKHHNYNVAKPEDS